MAQRDTRHHGQHHGAHGTGGEGVDGADLQHGQAQHAQAQQGRARDQPQVTQVQHRQQRLGQRGIAVPAQYPAQVQRCRHQQQYTDDVDLREDGPGQQGAVQAGGGADVEPAAGAGLQLAALGQQPVAREGRDDARTDHRHQDAHGRQRQAPVQALWNVDAAQLQVHGQVGHGQQRHRHWHGQVAVVAGGDDVMPGQRTQRDREGQVGGHGQPPGQQRREGAGQAARQPEAGQYRQQRAAHGRAAGPVGDGGEQEAGDGGQDPAEQHFVDMPGQRIEAAGQGEMATQHAHPQEDGQRGPEAAQQEEGPEGQAQDGRLACGGSGVDLHAMPLRWRLARRPVRSGHSRTTLRRPLCAEARDGKRRQKATTPTCRSALQSGKGAGITGAHPFSGSLGLCGAGLVGALADGDLAVHGRQHGLEGGGDDVGIDAHTETGRRFVQSQLDVAGSLGIGAGADGVFMEVHQLDVQAQGMHEGIDGAVAAAAHGDRLAIAHDIDFDVDRLGPGSIFRHAMRTIDIGLDAFQVFTLEDGVDVGSIDFLAGGIGLALDGTRELDLQAARQGQAVFLFQQVGHATLAGLAVDADHRVVAAAQVGRVDRQVGHFPDGVGLLLGEALLDGILVRAGEGGEDQVAHIRVTRVYRNLVAFFHHLAHHIDVGEVQARVHTLGVQVQCQRDQVDVAGTLAVAEQAAFDAVGAGHDGQLGRGHGGAAVIVRVDRDDGAGAILQVAAHPFDLVGVDIGRGALDGGGQVQDDLALGRGTPGFADGVADVLGEVQFGGAEGFRRILEAPFGTRTCIGQFLDQLGAGDGDVLDLVTRHVEDDLAEGRCHRVVQVDDGFLGAFQGFDSAADQFFARLGQHDDGDVVGDAVFFDQLAHKIEIGLRGRGEADFDFLQAGLQEQFEEAQLALGVHRFDQGLVAIAQVGAHPDRRGGDDLAGPGTVGQVDGGEGAVLGGGVVQHHDGPLVLVCKLRGMRQMWRIGLPGCHERVARQPVIEPVAASPAARGSCTACKLSWSSDA
eukprot:TRINITY_DN734_c3_g8_i1.p1 TRINITY_DN734_c3_g8~~TRINITY_DN734_c3_g8_i1.p1  ORF type:complete len:1015 (+),score=377.72 TRINITY_DN734_c3_g8_i1:1333-4377(+)